MTYLTTVNAKNSKLDIKAEVKVDVDTFDYGTKTQYIAEVIELGVWSDRRKAYVSVSEKLNYYISTTLESNDKEIIDEFRYGDNYVD